MCSFMVEGALGIRPESGFQLCHLLTLLYLSESQFPLLFNEKSNTHSLQAKIGLYIFFIPSLISPRAEGNEIKYVTVKHSTNERDCCYAFWGY